MRERTGQAHVREADGNDLKAVLAIGHRTWPATYAPIAGQDYVTMGLAKWWTPDATIPAIRAHRVLVAELGEEEVVGMASFAPRDGNLVLWKIYVLPERQGKGVGSALLDAVVERGSGLYPHLLVSYIDGSAAAERFYRSHGFIEDSREEGTSGLPDTIWMRRPLDTPDDANGEP